MRCRSIALLLAGLLVIPLPGSTLAADPTRQLLNDGQVVLEGAPPIPPSLAEELETNPFLRAGLPAVKSALSMSGDSDAAVFAENGQQRRGEPADRRLPLAVVILPDGCPVGDDHEPVEVG